MTEVISLHSSRGGTGKTVIGVNLAALLASKGLNVTLVDLDFRAPSLYHTFRPYVEPPSFWVNDYLNLHCEPDDFLVGVGKALNLKGNLLLGFANPHTRAIEDMLGKSRSWEATALKRLFDLKRFLGQNLNNDVCLCDTSPGIHYSSLNAMMYSDHIVFVSTSDPLEIEQIANMLEEYNDVFEGKTSILLNKAFPETSCLHHREQEEQTSRLLADVKIPLIGTMPCYCDVLTTQTRLLMFEKRGHPFFSRLEEVARVLISDQKNERERQAIPAK